MKILNERIKFLTKRETFDILVSDNRIGTSDEEIIKYTIKEYCEDALYDCDDIMEKLQEFKLFPLEIYQLMNTPSKSLLTLQLIIDEMEERYTSKELNEILELFNNPE
jgi:RNA polymerase Rpb4